MKKNNQNRAKEIMFGEHFSICRIKENKAYFHIHKTFITTSFENWSAVTFRDKNSDVVKRGVEPRLKVSRPRL